MINIEDVTLSHLEDELVDNGGRDTSEDGAEPVDPVVGPHVVDGGGSEGPGGVHAGARQLYGKQVAGSDGQADGEGCRASHTPGVVFVCSRGKHDQDQHHRDEELHTKGLAWGDGTYSTTAHTSHRVGLEEGTFICRQEDTQHAGSDNCSQALSYDVEQTLH